MRENTARKAPEAGSAIEHIAVRGEVFAILVRGTLPREGYHFVTEPEQSLQVGVNNYRQGQEIKPHYHLPLPRSLKDTLEVLHIDSGRCTITLYDESQTHFYETVLEAGDTILLMRGGHGLTMLAPTRIIETKQGPYLGPDKDKRVFEPKG